jgi:non-specific serine/threonine protein kinase
VGGCTLAAVEQVVGAPAAPSASALEALAALVEHSLVRLDGGGAADPDEEPRYRMLETVRAYALERLEASGDEGEVRERHSAYFLTLVTEARPLRQQVRDWDALLMPYYDNLQASFRWLGEQQDFGRCARLGDDLWTLLLHLSFITEGRVQARSLVTKARSKGSSPELALFLRWAAQFAYRAGDLAEARALAEEALAVWRELGGPTGIVSILNHLGIYLREQGDFAAARTALEEALVTARAVGDRQSTLEALIRLGEAAQAQGDLVRTRACYEESRAISLALGEHSVRLPHHLGTLAFDEGDYAGARRWFRESLALQRELTSWEWTHSSLADLATVAAAEGHAERAVFLAGASAGASEQTGEALQPTEQDRLDPWLDRARRALGAEAAAAAWKAGRATPLERVVAEALADELDEGTAATPLPAGGHLPSSLTRREREVALLLAAGRTDREIAAELTITEGTAGLHVHHVLAKLGLRSRWQVAEWAARPGLREPPSG